MPANYVLLERIELNASAASVTFSNIPQSGYTDLMLVTSARSDAGSFTFGDVSFNGSSTGITSRYLEGNGTTAVSASDQPRVVMGSPGSSTTASTYGNTQLYIPNYLSSNYKSYSVDMVGENNATTAYMQLFAGLWSNTAAINSITITAQSSRNFVQYSTFSLYGLAAVGTTPAIAPKASGGNITTDGTYWYHTFLTSGSFVPQTSLTADALVIAGGGAGASRSSGGAGEGGGGAGGFLGFSNQALTATSYTVTVGAGGTASSASNGTNGSDSQFGALTLVKGGGGGANRGTGGIGSNGADGGSGGGCSYNALGGNPTSGQGYKGGDGSASRTNGTGGGGAGGAGSTTPNSTTAGDGGVGLNTYSSWASATSSGVSGYYAGGGGGAYSSGSMGNGGSGGGTAGSTTTATAATVNTGGGGGAGETLGGAGGSGIVIIRYLAA